ncbi:response regulator transcription factor [Roseicyclus marinus]|uniref:response regulator transcription factor n=1 Tax=Roseicyclus marinus TaxID=2161673 RepID=UPI0024106954|nr:response regulator transcription factor [Roseicyclus marinus]MDG3042519.1 response regulator transcription factor [Roseicyclus marinus]
MRILVADDHDLVRETIAAFLKSEAQAEVSTAGSLADALEMVATNGAFDLVLLDYNMPGMNGLEGLRRMIASNGDKPVAVISGTTTRALAEEVLNAGAQGFVPKTLSSKSMVTAARFMAAGEIYAPFQLVRDRDEAASELLTPRETDVLRGVCRGQSNKEIALDFDLAEATVKLHVKTLCRKLDAKNRTHAAMIARDRNLV